MKVRILPKSKRAKNRVHEHGEIMNLMQETTRNGSNMILVSSIEKTWSLRVGVKQHWMGWFDNNEATWEHI